MVAKADESTPLRAPLAADSKQQLAVSIGAGSSFDYSATLRRMTNRKLQRLYGEGGRSSAVAAYVNTAFTLAVVIVLIAFYFFPTFTTEGLCENSTHFSLNLPEAEEKEPVLVGCDTAYAVIANNFILWCTCISAAHYFASKIFWNSSTQFRIIWNLSVVWNIIFNSLLLLQCTSLSSVIDPRLMDASVKAGTPSGSLPEGSPPGSGRMLAEAADAIAAGWGAVEAYAGVTPGRLLHAVGTAVGRRLDSSPFPTATSKALNTWWLWLYLIVFVGLWVYCIIHSVVACCIMRNLREDSKANTPTLMGAYDVRPADTAAGASPDDVEYNPVADQSAPRAAGNEGALPTPPAPAHVFTYRAPVV